MYSSDLKVSCCCDAELGILSDTMAKGLHCFQFSPSFLHGSKEQIFTQTSCTKCEVKHDFAAPKASSAKRVRLQCSIFRTPKVARQNCSCQSQAVQQTRQLLWSESTDRHQCGIRKRPCKDFLVASER